MSVGHVARALERAGIPTVAVFIRAFRHVVEAMAVPRAVITPHLMGRTIGAPGDRETHREVVNAALRLLADADRPGTLVDVDGALGLPGH